MPRKPLVIEITDQNIISDILSEDLSFDPAQVRRFYVNNKFQRTLAHLVAKAPTQSRLLTCTSTGILKVALTGAGFERNDTKSGNAPDSYSTAIVFDSVVSRVDIYVKNNAMMFKRSFDGNVWDDEFEVPANSIKGIDVTTHSFNVENATAGQVAAYEIIGWW